MACRSCNEINAVQSKSIFIGKQAPKEKEQEQKQKEQQKEKLFSLDDVVEPFKYSGTEHYQARAHQFI